MRNSKLIICASALVLTAVSGAVSGRRADNDAKACFEKLKSLKGEWVGKDQVNGKDVVKLRFRVTAGGSAVEETELPGTPYEMVTVYHMDGDSLVMTHYCAMGNQPRMKLKAGSTTSKLVFECVGGTNMKSHNDGHMHALTISLPDDKHFASTWTMLTDGKKAQEAKFESTRK